MMILYCTVLLLTVVIYEKYRCGQIYVEFFFLVKIFWVRLVGGSIVQAVSMVERVPLFLENSWRTEPDLVTMIKTWKFPTISHGTMYPPTPLPARQTYCDIPSICDIYIFRVFAWRLSIMSTFILQLSQIDHLWLLRIMKRVKQTNCGSITFHYLKNKPSGIYIYREKDFNFRNEFSKYS